MRAACELGALSGARRYRDALGDFGENLGMAFQITDDLLDYREEMATTGKPSGLDLKEHKVTLPLIHALRQHILSLISADDSALDQRIRPQLANRRVRLHRLIHHRLRETGFVAVLLLLAVQMGLAAFGIHLPGARS